MVEIYYNSGQFEYSTRFLEHFFAAPMQLYQELSDFYENSGMDLLAHSRIRRYEILLDFYVENVVKTSNEAKRQDFINVFKEIMVLDLYLREDMKSRPPFASVPVRFKDYPVIYEASGTDRKDIHVEHFNYDIFASCESGHAVKKDNFILFDYGKRDPLNKAAGITKLA